MILFLKGVGDPGERENHADSMEITNYGDI